MYLFNRRSIFFIIYLFGMTAIGLLTMWNEQGRLAQWQADMNWVPGEDTAILRLSANQPSEPLDTGNWCYRYRAYPHDALVTEELWNQNKWLPSSANYGIDVGKKRRYTLDRSGVLFFERRWDEDACTSINTVAEPAWNLSELPPDRMEQNEVVQQQGRGRNPKDVHHFSVRGSGKVYRDVNGQNQWLAYATTAERPCFADNRAAGRIIAQRTGEHTFTYQSVNAQGTPTVSQLDVWTFAPVAAYGDCAATFKELKKHGSLRTAKAVVDMRKPWALEAPKFEARDKPVKKFVGRETVPDNVWHRYQETNARLVFRGTERGKQQQPVQIKVGADQPCLADSRGQHKVHAMRTAQDRFEYFTENLHAGVWLWAFAPVHGTCKETYDIYKEQGSLRLATNVVDIREPWENLKAKIAHRTVKLSAQWEFRKYPGGLGQKPHAVVPDPDKPCLADNRSRDIKAQWGTGGQILYYKTTLTGTTNAELWSFASELGDCQKTYAEYKKRGLLQLATAVTDMRNAPNVTLNRAVEPSMFKRTRVVSAKPDIKHGTAIINGLWQEGRSPDPRYKPLVVSLHPSKVCYADNRDDRFRAVRAPQHRIYYYRTGVIPMRLKYWHFSPAHGDCKNTFSIYQERGLLAGATSVIDRRQP